MRALRPPEHRPWPLVDHLFQGHRLDNQLPGFDELGQPLLLLEGKLQIDRPDPVEGSPHSASFLGRLDEAPELAISFSTRGLLIRPHQQPPLALQSPRFEAILLELGA